MPNAAAHLDLYREMAELARRMAESARAMEWEQLAAQGKALRALEVRQPPDNEGLDAAALEKKSVLIREIIDSNAETLRFVEPWMEDVRELLGGPALRRRVENAYLAGKSPLS